VIIKPNNSSSSRNVFEANNVEDIKAIYNYLERKDVDPIIQKKIKGTEITCGVLKLGGKIYSISLEREIFKGTSYQVKPYSNHILDTEIKRIAELLDFQGSINMQFIKDKFDNFYLIEINGRFSGTTFMRQLNGFESVKAVIDYTLNKRHNQNDLKNTEKFHFSRYWEEIPWQKKK